MNLTSGTLMAGVFALCTALFWGTYGPLLSRGHHLMGTEGRLRPSRFDCIAVEVVEEMVGDVGHS